jgi:hypothetical protein
VLKFNVDLGGGETKPTYNFCWLHNLKRECSLELCLQNVVQKPLITYPFETIRIFHITNDKNLVPRIFLLRATLEERPWSRLVTCLPDFVR